MVGIRDDFMSTHGVSAISGQCIAAHLGGFEFHCTKLSGIINERSRRHAEGPAEPSYNPSTVHICVFPYCTSSVSFEAGLALAQANGTTHASNGLL